MSTTVTTPTSAVLFWNEQGQVLCATHAPGRGTDTWIFEHWQKVPAIPETSHVCCETCKYAHVGGHA